MTILKPTYFLALTLIIKKDIGMKKFLILPLLLLSFCFQPAVAQNMIDLKVAQAILAIDEGDYTTAQTTCDEIVSENWSKLSHENKCNLAICYAALFGELDYNEESNLFALKLCFNSAKKESEYKTRKYLDSIEDGMYDAIALIVEAGELAKKLGY